MTGGRFEPGPAAGARRSTLFVAALLCGAEPIYRQTLAVLAMV